MSNCWLIPVAFLPIVFRVPSLALGQSYDCPTASEVTLKDISKINQCQFMTKHNKAQTECLFLGVYLKLILHINCGFRSSKLFCWLTHWGQVMHIICIGKLCHYWFIWVRSRRCGCLVTWFYYQMIAKPGNTTAAPLWPDSYNGLSFVWGQAIIWNNAGLLVIGLFGRNLRNLNLNTTFSYQK